MFNFSIVRGLVLWVLVILFNFIRTGNIRYKFAFSVKNYYLLMLVFLADPIYQSLKIHSWFPTVLFLIFACAGVLGETLFSFWWHTFYENKFWSYRVETLVHGYTSLLNFIPWAVGGTIYLNIAQSFHPVFVSAFSDGLPFWLFFVFGLIIGLLAQSAVWVTLRGNKGKVGKFTKVTVGNYLFFILPYLIGLAFCIFVYGRIFFYFAISFALIAGTAEYLFGKAVEFFISKKLWVYNYLAIDNGHFTPLSLIPFSLAGFYFLAIASVVSLIH